VMQIGINAMHSWPYVRCPCTTNKCDVMWSSNLACVLIDLAKRSSLAFRVLSLCQYTCFDLVSIAATRSALTVLCGYLAEKTHCPERAFCFREKRELRRGWMF
jgi:hypothetical protein